MKAFEGNPAFQSQNEIDASFTDGRCIFLLKTAAYYERSPEMAVQCHHALACHCHCSFCCSLFSPGNVMRVGIS